MSDNEHEERIDQATWALIDADTDVVDRGVSGEHYRERRAEVERIAPILAAGFRHAHIEDVEPVAYEVRDKATGAYIGIFPVADAEDRRTRIVYPLYRHPAAPIEVTDEAVRAGAFVLDEGAMDSPADYPLQGEAALSTARDVIEAAFKEMNR